jgi:hypothetical protein
LPMRRTYRATEPSWSLFATDSRLLGRVVVLDEALLADENVRPCAKLTQRVPCRVKRPDVSILLHMFQRVSRFVRGVDRGWDVPFTHTCSFRQFVPNFIKFLFVIRLDVHVWHGYELALCLPDDSLKIRPNLSCLFDCTQRNSSSRGVRCDADRPENGAAELGQRHRYVR